MCRSAFLLSFVLLSPMGLSQEQEPPEKTDELGWTGVLSEEEFKKLHDLRKDDVPDPLGEEITLSGGSKAYLSLPPDQSAPFDLGIVVIHEWWGLNRNIRHWTDRLAAAGYAALAVDLYGGQVAETRDQAMEAMRSVDEAKALKTLKAAHQRLVEDEKIQAGRTASIGWCFGGGWSLRLALAEPALDGAVIYYGRPVTDPEELKAIEAKVLGIFGKQDQSIPPERVDELERALKEAEVEAEILRYDADHAFANPSGGRYDEKAAAAAWKKVQDFLKSIAKE